MIQNTSLRDIVNDGGFVLYNFVRTILVLLLLFLPLPLLLPRFLFLLLPLLFFHDDHILVYLLLIVKVFVIPPILHLDIRHQEILQWVWPGEMAKSKYCNLERAAKLNLFLIPKIIFYHFGNIILAGVHVILEKQIR